MYFNFVAEHFVYLEVVTAVFFTRDAAFLANAGLLFHDVMTCCGLFSSVGYYAGAAAVPRL